MRAMILLGINGGFGNADCGQFQPTTCNGGECRSWDGESLLILRRGPALPMAGFIPSLTSMASTAA
jgi:hypothetical protein